MTDKPKITKQGQPCRKCGNPVVRRKGGNRIKPGQKYYFKFYLYCERCKTTYLLNSEKIYKIILPTRKEVELDAELWVKDKPYPATNFNSYMECYDRIINQIKELNLPKTFELEILKEENS